MNHLRALRAGGAPPAGAVTIWLADGYYNLSQGLVFGSGDGGTADAPLLIAAEPGAEPHITGAVTLDPGWFGPSDSGGGRLPASAAGNVLESDLPSHGVTNFGAFQVRGYGLSAPAPLELFCNGQPMTLARWPNAGSPLAQVAAASDSQHFTYSSSRPSQWSRPGEVWMHGLWGQNWADYELPVAAIDAGSQTVTLAQPPPQFGIAAGQPYYACNMLEELDTPGEYYLDRASGQLYFWPPWPLAQSVLQASIVEDSLITVNGAAYLTLQGLILEAARGPLVTVNSGDHVRLEQCLLRNSGQYGALVAGTNSGLDECEVVNCGEEGVRLQGGDRAALVAAGNFVTNCRISRTARVAWMYKPGVSLELGCGNVVSHNWLSAMPHAGLLFSGNNHLIEGNDIGEVCGLTTDAGAIYAGRSWGWRGDQIIQNYIHDISSALGSSDVNGVYLDDCMSGVAVQGNVFYAVAGTAIFCGGGRDNLMNGNVIAACGLAHYDDDRGRLYIDDTPGDSWNLLEGLTTGGIDYQSGIWAASYPACALLPDSWPALQQGLWLNPQNCAFSSNVGWSNGGWTLEDDSSGTGVFSVYASMADDNPSEPALFQAAAAEDRTLRPASLVASVAGFPAIAFGAIGPDDSELAAASKAPPAPWLSASAGASASQISLSWSDGGDLPEQRPSGFAVQMQAAGSGAWVTTQTSGPDVNQAIVGGLAPNTAYTFAVTATNAMGSAQSNLVAITTPSAAPVAGASTLFEAADGYSVVNDVAINGTIGASAATLDSASSVRLYDAGDAIALTIVVPQNGLYQIGLRSRSGGSSGPTSFWPSGYQLALDGSVIALTGDPASISTLDPAYGGCFWGTMVSGNLTLTAGSHRVVVTAEASWAVAGYVALTAMIPAAAPGAAALSASLPQTAGVGTIADGTTAFLGGACTLTACSADIWNSTVGFQYAYAPLAGDASLTVRVVSLDDTDPWAKAGLIVSPSLKPTAAYAGIFVTPGEGVALQWRPAARGPCQSLQLAGLAAPCWVRLVRQGSNFNGYASTDGQTWQPVGGCTVAMASPVLEGLALTSHNAAAAAQAVFDSFAASPPP